MLHNDIYYYYIMQNVLVMPCRGHILATFSNLPPVYNVVIHGNTTFTTLPPSCNIMVTALPCQRHFRVTATLLQRGNHVVCKLGRLHFCVC